MFCTIGLWCIFDKHITNSTYPHLSFSIFEGLYWYESTTANASFSVIRANGYFTCFLACCIHKKQFLIECSYKNSAIMQRKKRRNKCIAIIYLTRMQHLFAWGNAIKRVGEVSYPYCAVISLLNIHNS